MVPLSSIGRAGAVAGIDGASALSGTNRAGGVSFGKSLEYVIGTSQADHQEYSGGNGGQTGNMCWQQVDYGEHGGNGGMQSPRLWGLHTNDQQVAATLSPPMGGDFKSVKSMDRGIQPANTQQMGVQEKSQPFTPGPATGLTDPNVASGTMTQQAQGATAPQPQKADNYGEGTAGGYQFDFGPSTLDPGTMAFLLAWMGSGSTQQIEQQQQAYLDTYRQRYPNGVPGVKNYITPTTNYLTHTS